MVDWTELLARYGYLAVFVGTFLEGESILVAGSLAAQAGVLSLTGVFAAALCGSFLGDQVFFQLGRRLGPPWLARRPKWQQRAQRVYRLLERHDLIFILGFRFLYGLRSVSPFVVGSSNMRASRFFFFNLLGAMLWVFVVGTLGFWLGHLWLILPAGTFTGPRIALAFLVGAAFGYWLLRRRRQP